MRGFGSKIAAAYRRFMTGRYGSDKLNMAILTAGLVLSLVCLFLRWEIPKLVLTVLAYSLLIWSVFRSLSRNVYKRYRENRKFLLLVQRLKDRDHRYYDCPRCRQQVRVPRGKGKISITCPKCREKFIRKT